MPINFYANPVRMANHSQLVVLVGVFLTAILVQYLFQIQENFAPKKMASKPRTQKTTGRGAVKPPAGAAKAPAKAPAKPPAKAAAAAPAKAPPISNTTAAVAGAVAGGAGAAGGLKFSELIQSLIAYTPVKQASGVLGAEMGGRGALQSSNIGDGARLINEVRMAVRDELAVQGKGPTNDKLANRGTRPVLPSTPKVKSPSLNQGIQYGGRSSPYGMTRGGGCGGGCGNASGCGCNDCGSGSGCGNEFGQDMSAYVKRENVFGL